MCIILIVYMDVCRWGCGLMQSLCSRWLLLYSLRPVSLWRLPTLSAPLVSSGSRGDGLADRGGSHYILTDLSLHTSPNLLPAVSYGWVLLFSDNPLKGSPALLARLPCGTGRVANIPRAEKVCTLCSDWQSSNEQSLVFECLTLQGVTDACNGLFGDHAATMVHVAT
jgi:hypothetical protein